MKVYYKPSMDDVLRFRAWARARPEKIRHVAVNHPPWQVFVVKRGPSFQRITMARDQKGLENYEGDWCSVTGFDERDSTMIIKILQSEKRGHVGVEVKKIPENALEPIQ